MSSSTPCCGFPLCELLIVENQFQYLCDTLSTISSVLLDSEENRGILPHTQRLIIQKLQLVLHEGEDVIDKYLYLNLLRDQILSSNSNRLIKKVRIFLAPANPITCSFRFSRAIAKTIKLVESVAFKRITMPNHDTDLPTRQTYSFIPEEEVIGRDDDKYEIEEMLLGSSKVQPHEDVLAIVGLGGLGKTTLAQLIFNDEKIVSYFEHRMWVSVPDEFHIRDILKEMIESLSRKPIFLSAGLDMESLQIRLFREIEGKLFLLVLDDLSIHDAKTWDAFKQILIRGARGSKILVTTRSEHTSSVIGAKPYHLRGLSDDNCWSLFQRLALDPIAISERKGFVEVGKEIVRRCGNVPLIIRLVANLLYQKPLEKWMQFRDENKNIMDIFNRDKKGEVLKVLRPSYDQLPPLLKLCFNYCSLFPRGYEFNKHDLIHLWMAQGFLSPTDKHRSLEDVGENCFFELLGRCYFQDVKRDVMGDIISCQMHDIMHHLAQNIAGGKFIIGPNFPKFDARALHTSIRFDGNFPETLLQAHKTRTLLLLKESACRRKLERSICQKLISNLKHLRALDLHDCGIDMLPSNIGDLIHLRYLDLSKNDALVRLPASVTKLYYIQTLKLNFCQKLKRLPKDIGKLINLRCLEIDECDNLTYMPLGLRKLNHLHTLNRFVVCTPGFHDNRSGGIRILNTLNNLRGRLKIELSGKWTTIVQEALEANLRGKTNLTELKIEWRLGGIDDKQAYYYYGAFLEGLQPPTSLKVLCIEGYRGKDFPSWARMDKLASVLPNLVIISMEGCRECKYLPPFRQLKSLKCLTLRHMEEVQHVENGTYDPQQTTFFPSLSELTLHSFHNLKGWWKELGGMQQCPAFPSFPCLSKLKIWNCPNLTVMPLFSRVEEVDFQNVNQKLLKVSMLKAASTSTSTVLASSPSSSSIPSTLKHRTSFSLVQPHRTFSSGWLENIPNLKRLHIKACPNVKVFPTIGGGGFSSVQFLVIDKCDALISLAEGLQHLRALEELELSHCKELNLEDDRYNNSNPWGSLCKLRYLTFRGLPKMNTLPEGLQEIKTLKFLWISTCSSLTELPEWLDQISSLQQLRIEACPKLKQLPQNICSLRSLVKLEIMECPQLMESCREPKGNCWPNIKHIPRVLLHKSWRYGLMNDEETAQMPEIMQAQFLTDGGKS